MQPRYSLAKRKAVELLKTAGIRKPPVPVEDLPQLVEAELHYEPFDGEVSGMLLRRGNKVLIGINQSDPSLRQRFSLAHEIAHLLLHRAESFHLDERHPVRFRNALSSTGQDAEEVEANQFAAELLMPSEFIKNDVQEYVGRDAEEAVRDLADRYQVSQQAMTIRLGALGYIR